MPITKGLAASVEAQQQASKTNIRNIDVESLNHQVKNSFAAPLLDSSAAGSRRGSTACMGPGGRVAREQVAEEARGRPAQAGIPLPSFRRRPESSGLNNPFPRSGNDNHRNDNRTRHPAKPATHSPLNSQLDIIRFISSHYTIAAIIARLSGLPALRPHHPPRRIRMNHCFPASRHRLPPRPHGAKDAKPRRQKQPANRYSETRAEVHSSWRLFFLGSSE